MRRNWRRGGGWQRKSANFLPKEDVFRVRPHREDIPPKNLDLPVEDDFEDRRLLCISLSNGSLGAALYDQAAQRVDVLNDVDEDSDFRTIESLIKQLSPSDILVNKSQDFRMVQHLGRKYGELETPMETLTTTTTATDENGMESDMPGAAAPEKTLGEQVSNEREEAEDAENAKESGDDEGENGTSKINRVEIGSAEKDLEESDIDDDDGDEIERDPSIKLVQLTNNHFRLDSALARVNELLTGSDERLLEHERRVMLQFRINFVSTNMIRAAGALLCFMDGIRLGVEGEPLHIRTPIKCVKAFVLPTMVEMDWNTMRALDVFSTRSDKWTTSRMSERCESVFDMCNTCKSVIGRRTLRKWFRSPTMDRNVLRSRQNAVSYFSQDCNLDVTSGLLKCFGRLRGIDTMKGLLTMGRLLLTREVQLDMIEEVREKDVNEIEELIVVINSMVDFDESRTEGRTTVVMGIDPALDECKYLYRQLPSLLTSVATEEAANLGIDDCECSCVYVPIVGYLLVLPKGFPVDKYPDMHVLYTTKSRVHVKCSRTEKLDEELGDTKMQIVDKEAVILRRLKKMLLRRKNEMKGLLRSAAALDAVIAMSIAARRYGWTCPILVDEPVISATSSVHPLAAAINVNFVPNSVFSGDDDSKVKIFTGPNACGKSIYLKQIGLMVYMASIGSFVAARQARIGPIDRVLTRMYTVDSVLDGMSTFAIDVGQVATALRRSTGNSLVIIDEFGKGTMMEVGLSLLASCLSHWIEKGVVDCPHILLSSHFHSLVKYIPDCDFLTYHTLQVNRAEGRVQFMYKLVDGLVDCSFAINTAREEGVDDDVLLRAIEVYEHMQRGEPLRTIPCRIDNQRDDRIAARMGEIFDQIISWDPKDEVGFAKFIADVTAEDVGPEPGEEHDELGADAEERDAGADTVGDIIAMRRLQLAEPAEGDDGEDEDEGQNPDSEPSDEEHEEDEEMEVETAVQMNSEKPNDNDNNNNDNNNNSILKGLGKKSLKDRGNYSVSFAVDGDESIGHQKSSVANLVRLMASDATNVVVNDGFVFKTTKTAIVVETEQNVEAQTKDLPKEDDENVDDRRPEQNEAASDESQDVFDETYRSSSSRKLYIDLEEVESQLKSTTGSQMQMQKGDENEEEEKGGDDAPMPTSTPNPVRRSSFLMTQLVEQLATVSPVAVAPGTVPLPPKGENQVEEDASSRMTSTSGPPKKRLRTRSGNF